MGIPWGSSGGSLGFLWGSLVGLEDPLGLLKFLWSFSGGTVGFLMASWGILGSPWGSSGSSLEAFTVPNACMGGVLGDLAFWLAGPTEGQESRHGRQDSMVFATLAFPYPLYSTTFACLCCEGTSACALAAFCSSPVRCLSLSYVRPSWGDRSAWQSAWFLPLTYWRCQ